MAVLVWLTAGVAIWHFTVFVPDRFWGGIVGAFIASVLGALVTGALWQMATGDSVGQTDVLTLLAAVPGAIGGMAIAYAVGSRAAEDEALAAGAER